MRLEDIKVGMKVKLLGKHRCGSYNDIEDWFEYYNKWKEVQQIKKQGFGVVTEIDKDDDIWVAASLGDNEWCFSISDLEPYDDEDVIKKNNEEIKKMTLKEIEKELGYKIEIVGE